MDEQNIINKFVTALELGSMAEFQIEERLTLEGLPIFEIEKLIPKIKETYQKRHPCY